VYLAYQAFLFLLLLIASPYLLARTIFGGHGFRERLGFWRFVSDERKVAWFHAASMGELKVISSILPELLKINPDLRMVISTITKTGHEKASKLFAPIEVFYLPLDLRSCVKRALDKVKPSLLVLVETEIWPMLIDQADRANVKIAVVNGRISEKSFRLYKIFGKLFSSTLHKVDYVLGQTEDNRQRFINLGMNPSKVADYGNIKFDQVLDRSANSLPQELANHLSRQDRFVFVAGSIWPKEFGPVIESIKTIMNINPQFIAILAPRHLKNLKRLEETLQFGNVSYFKRSQIEKGTAGAGVIILDTMGELSSLYHYADLAFVGGSFVNVGGHDPLEPASAGCLVCFGPNMQNSRMFADIIVKAGGAFYLNDGDELAELLKKLIENKALATELGGKARQAVLDHAGVSRQIAGKLAEYI
jgi:3-deoxy-D-manno-octulosonic-acid transferase